VQKSYLTSTKSFQGRKLVEEHQMAGGECQHRKYQKLAVALQRSEEGDSAIVNPCNTAPHHPQGQKCYLKGGSMYMAGIFF